LARIRGSQNQQGALGCGLLPLTQPSHYLPVRYTRLCREWRRKVGEESPCAAFQVETSLIVPILAASDQLEPSAASLRPKIHRQLRKFLVPLQPTLLERPAVGTCSPVPPEVAAAAAAVGRPEELLASLSIDRSVPRVDLRGGEREAHRVLQRFLTERLHGYGNGKAGDPTQQSNSFLSPYLHFGHISALQVAIAVQQAAAGPLANAGKHSSLAGASTSTAFLEELIVRRELARNLAWFLPDGYDRWAAVPNWAHDSLLLHEADPRPQVYSLRQLEQGDTGDTHWNAAQWQMLVTGHMHNYMRHSA